MDYAGDDLFKQHRNYEVRKSGMMAFKTDIQQLSIEATVYQDRVEELHDITDSARNIRRRPQTKVWQTNRVLGYGSFGEVRLERNKENEKERAVKKIGIKSASLRKSEYEKKLKALLEFSKPKANEKLIRLLFSGIHLTPHSTERLVYSWIFSVGSRMSITSSWQWSMSHWKI